MVELHTLRSPLAGRFGSRSDGDEERGRSEVQRLSLDTASPTLRVRSGKGGKTRLVPVHPELHGALSSALAYGDITQGRIISAVSTDIDTAAWALVVAQRDDLPVIRNDKSVHVTSRNPSHRRK